MTVMPSYYNRPLPLPQAQVRPMRPSPFYGGGFRGGMFGGGRPPPFMGGGRFGGRMPRRSPYGGGMFGGGGRFGGRFGGRRPPPFMGGGGFGGFRPTFMNRMGGDGRFGGMQRPPFGGGFRPPFGGSTGEVGGNDYSAQISELEKKIKELQAQFSGQPAASPEITNSLKGRDLSSGFAGFSERRGSPMNIIAPEPPTASYNPVPQVDVDAFQQFKAGISPDRDEYLAGIRAENQLRQDKINSGELVPDPAQMDQGPRRYVTKAEAEMRMRQRDASIAIDRAKTPQQRQAEMMALNRAQEKAAGIAGISVPNFNTPPGTPIAIPPSVGGQYEEPAREFLKGTPAPLDPNYILQPGDPGYVTSGPAVPDFLIPNNTPAFQFQGPVLPTVKRVGRPVPPTVIPPTVKRGGIGGLSGMMGGAVPAPIGMASNDNDRFNLARMMMNRR